MNEQNFDYLARQLKFTGFGEDHRVELLEKMHSEEPVFTIGHQANFGTDHAEAELYFRKPDTGDVYFFNGYLLRLENEKMKETLAQSFRVGRDFSVTLKEAYNLMKRRAIHKEITPREGEKYKAWIQLNFDETDDYGNYKFRIFHQNYGFDLRETLAGYPIRELENVESAQSLVRSLERGNMQSVTLMVEGKEEKMFIEASPQYKSLNLYDHYLNRYYPTGEMKISSFKKMESNTAGSPDEGPSERQADRIQHKEKMDPQGLDGEGSSPKKSRKQNQTLS